MPSAASRADIQAAGRARMFASLSRKCGPLLAVVTLALIQRALLPINADTSWLLTVGEKVLDGARPYIDFLEVNPPASILLYLPAVRLARLLHLSPEFMTGTLVFLATGASLWFSARILTVSVDRRKVWKLAALFAAALLVLPAQGFAQREHIALIVFLPVLAVCAVRASERSILLGDAVIAGLLAGIAVSIKPHLVLGLIFASLAAALHARSWRIIFAIENWMAALVCMLYGALILFAYPAFISDVLPLVSSIYVPVHVGTWKLLTHFATPIFSAALAAIIFFARRAVLPATLLPVLAAALGFAISFYIQRKGWPYHSYPMLALVLVALVIAFARRWPLDSTAGEKAVERMRRRTAAALVVLLWGGAYVWMSFSLDMRALADTIRNAAPRPGILAITSDIAVGHPLTRSVGGTWVGRVCSQWIATGAKILKAEIADEALRKRYDELEVLDRAMLTEDILRAKPEIILVDRIRYDWLEWAQSDAALARELENYRPLDTISGVLILRRKLPGD